MAQKQPVFNTKMIAIGAAALLLLIFAATVWGSYNNLVRLNQNVDKTWADVETQYQRRVDLIPNLVNVVESYAIFERETLTEITALRSQWQTSASATQRVDTANQLETALSKLLLISENYPDLKANQNFIGLQDSLAETENMVAVSRTRFNTAVRDYNYAVHVFPSNMIAGWFGFSQRQYFEAQAGASQVPKVEINIS